MRSLSIPVSALIGFALCLALITGLAAHEMTFFYFGLFLDSPPTSLQIAFCVFSCLSSALFIIAPLLFHFLEETDRHSLATSLAFDVFWLSVKVAAILVSRNRYNRFFIETQIPIVVFSAIAVVFALVLFMWSIFETPEHLACTVSFGKGHNVVRAFVVFLAPLLAFSWMVMGLWASSYLTHGMNYVIVWLPLLLRFADVALPSLELWRFFTLVSRVSVWKCPIRALVVVVSPLTAMVMMSGTFLGMNPYRDDFGLREMQETGFIFGMIGTVVGCVLCAFLVLFWLIVFCFPRRGDDGERGKLVNNEK